MSKSLILVGRATLLLSLPVTVVHAQVDAVRRAGDALRGRVPSVESLFGSEPAITTSIGDARDGVPLLDTFEPMGYAPMVEMPRGQDGTILLVPGTYAMLVKSFCLQPGTFGPQVGDGYLHVTWEGPKADLITRILQRSAGHPEVPQYHVQMLLWAILSRTDPRNLQREAQDAATRLLTPAEMAELSGYGLEVVPNALRDRVLSAIPEPARRVLVAENELRRLLGSASAQYADLERVAVLNGVVPADEAADVIPPGRWSYHPSGFFIRYAPTHYSMTNIDVYFPDTVAIERDASGRIISIRSKDGRSVRPVEPLVRRVSLQRYAVASRADLLRRVADRSGADPRADLVALAHADVEDLLSILESLGADGHARAQPAGEVALVREALHAALARFYGIARSNAVPSGSSLERRLRPVRTATGFRYVVAPVAVNAQHPGRMMPLQPSSGGAIGPGPRQRIGLSPAPMFLAGGNDPLRPGPDILEKAQWMTGTLDDASTSLTTFTDPAGYVAGLPGAWMLSQGLGQAFDAARTVANSMAGSSPDGGDDEEVASRAPSDASDQSRRTAIIPVSFTRLPTTAPQMHRLPPWRSQDPADYRVLSRPRTIAFTPVSGGVSPEHAEVLNGAIATTFRLAMTLEAWLATDQRLAAARTARDEDWQDRQGRALVYLKRTAGVEMVRLADEFARLGQTAGGGPNINEDEVAEAQRRLRTEGIPGEALVVAAQLGRSSADLEAARQRTLALDPKMTAVAIPGVLQRLQDALRGYGTLLASLPDVVPPWLN